MSYSGGSCTVTNGSPSGPYTLSNGKWGNGGTGASATCSGTITATFTWVGPNPPPTKVVITQTSSASAWAYTGSASAADGLGETATVQTTQIPPYTSSSSSGTHYSVVDGGASLTVQCAPTCSGSGSAANAGVSYSATAQPIAISLTGPVHSGSAYQLATGQLVSAAVSSPVATSADEYYWFAPGCNPFANYQVSTSGGVFTPFALPATSASNMSFYLGEAGTSTVECLYYSFLMDQTVDLTVQVTVEGPTRTNLTQTAGTMRLVHIVGGNVTDWTFGGAAPTDFKLWGANDGTIVAGCFKYDKLEDPQFLHPPGSNYSYGTWTYAQLLGGHATESFTNGTRIVPANFSGIDTAFPYPLCSIYSADGAEEGKFRDAPGAQGLQSLTQADLSFSLDHDQELQLFIFYKPADDAAGASVYVPTTRFSWNATGTCATSDLAHWTQSDGGSGFHVTTDYPWPFPVW